MDRSNAIIGPRQELRLFSSRWSMAKRNNVVNWPK
jgi:hypothetical protein